MDEAEEIPELLGTEIPQPVDRTRHVVRHKVGIGNSTEVAAEGEDTADPARMRLFRVDRFGDVKLAHDRGYEFEGFDAA